MKKAATTSKKRKSGSNEEKGGDPGVEVERGSGVVALRNNLHR
jgi:hypothetical protein